LADCACFVGWLVSTNPYKDCAVYWLHTAPCQHCKVTEAKFDYVCFTVPIWTCPAETQLWTMFAVMYQPDKQT